VKPRDVRTSKLICLQGKSTRHCRNFTLIVVDIPDWDWDQDQDQWCRFSEAGTEDASTVCWVVGFWGVTPEPH
jgi:hypothetical protein